MFLTLVDSALRSSFVGLVVATGLRTLRIRNIFVKKIAWGLMPDGALAMLPANPGIVPPAHPMTLLEELQARIQAKSGSSNLVRPIESGSPERSVPEVSRPPTENPSGTKPDTASASRAPKPVDPKMLAHRKILTLSGLER